MVDWIVFGVGSLLAIIGALGVITARNPVHSALLLVLTLFGVAILFVSMQAHFLAVVQVIVYAGAIVVIFLFVIMLLGVDRDAQHELASEPLRGQRPIAFVLGLAALAELVLVSRLNFVVGRQSVAGPADGPGTNVEKLAESVFTRYLFAFEVTSVLLVIAVVGAVLLSRKPRGSVTASAAGSGASSAANSASASSVSGATS